MPGAQSDALRSFVPAWRDGDLPGACHACISDGGEPKPTMPPPRQARADRLLPSGEAPQWYVRRFLSEFGVEPGEIGLFRDVAGEHLAIGESLFIDRHGEYKALKRGRERHVLLLADTIRSPDEIWMALETPDKGKKRLRRRYVARWIVEGMEVPALTVFEWSRDLWTGVTAFTPDEVSYLENRARLGTLVWKREP
jgi:hypothetical protein